MPDTVIKVEGLSKSYIISHQSNERYVALRDVITDRFKTFGSKFKLRNRTSSIKHPASSSKEEFFALKDVSFEIKRGDRVGIIGRNGAGKSTLLKILSRITEPSSGRITIKGRVASLLEVGTGFHPELTGRENIFLNGAILGMGKAEIKRKFDEIVAFAEIEKFLDTPVKRYSSGMYVRLAFAVAAHLEPEILIVDEVLAVGDAQFQQKCLGKMKEVGEEGRTVLFVSHNVSALTSLCGRGVLLKEGRVEFIGDVNPAISRYLVHGTDSMYIKKRPDKIESTIISRAWLEDKFENKKNQFVTGEPIAVVVETENPHSEELEVGLSFWDNLRRPLWNFTHDMYGYKPIPGNYKIKTKILFYPPKLTISEVLIDVSIGPKGGSPYYDHIVNGLKFTVVENNDGIIRKRWQGWPILCDTTMNYEILG